MDWIRGMITDPTLGGPPDNGRQVPTVQGLPITKPPYGRITAFDMNSGNIVWQVPHGETPDEILNHPALQDIDIPRTGRPGRGGVLTTSTLLISGEHGFATTPYGKGAMLRAYDKSNGNEVGAVFMPAPQTGAPMTYMLDGKQYVVLAVSGTSDRRYMNIQTSVEENYSGKLLAYTLPTRN